MLHFLSFIINIFNCIINLIKLLMFLSLFSSFIIIHLGFFLLLSLFVSQFLFIQLTFSLSDFGLLFSDLADLIHRNAYIPSLDSGDSDSFLLDFVFGVQFLVRTSPRHCPAQFMHFFVLMLKIILPSV